MEILVVKSAISREKLQAMATEQFGDFVKAVVDTSQGIMAVGGELHADEEVYLTEHEGSKREFMWGVNFYPARTDETWIEFDSMINLKPGLGNTSRGVEDSTVREKIIAIVERLIS